MKKTIASITLAGAVLVAAASSASAHVTVNPREATKGGFAKLAFRVPNERDDAGTTEVTVQFPADHPLAFVSVRPTPGWTSSLTRAKLPSPVTIEGTEVTEAVSTITWKGGTVNPGEFQEFEVSVGPLPDDADSLEFKALQTYSDGEVVRWIEETPASGEEPEHPAPVLTLVDGGEGGGHGSTATTEAGSDGESAQAASDDDGDSSDGDSSDGGARGMAIAGIALGAVALVVALNGRRRRA